MTPEELHRLPSYANHTFGRPINPNQCIGCGRMSLPGIVTIQVNSVGFCPACHKLRMPSSEVVVLFTPLRKASR